MHLFHGLLFHPQSVRFQIQEQDIWSDIKRLTSGLRLLNDYECETFYYFNQAQVLNSSFNESPGKWVNLLFHIPQATDENYYNYISQIEWYKDPASYTVVSITAFLSIFTLNTYLPTAILFAFISF